MIPKFDSNVQFFNYMQKIGWNWIALGTGKMPDEDLREAREQLEILLKSKGEKYENKKTTEF